MCTKCFDDTCTAYALKTKCLDTDRTLKNLERKFQTKLKEKVQEILHNDGNFYEIEEFESEGGNKHEPISEQYVIEEIVDEELEEIFVNEEEQEEVVPVASEAYMEVLEEYLEGEAEPQFKIEPISFPIKNQKFNCRECKPNIFFKTEIGLKVHEWDFHQIGNRDPLTCLTCNYTFEYEANKEDSLTRQMHKHLVAHASGKMNSCTICPEVFKSLHHLEEHKKRQHRKHMTNKCKACHSEFSTNQELQLHLITSSCKDQHQRPFKCYICNETFAMGIAKKKHIQIDHQDKAGADCPKCLRCKIPSAIAYENHYKTHFAGKLMEVT